MEANSVFKIIWDILYQYFLFGKRWILLIPIPLIISYFSFLKNYKDSQFRDTIKNPIFYIPSLIVTCICICVFLLLVNLPQPKDKFVIAIVEFSPVSQGATEESINFTHRLINNLERRNDQFEINFSINILKEKIGGTKQEKEHLAETLGKHNRAHIVIYGDVRVDGNEIFFKPVILNRVALKDIDIPVSSTNDIFVPRKLSNKRIIEFKEQKIENIVDFITFIAGLLKYENEDYDAASKILTSIKYQKPPFLFYAGNSLLYLGKRDEALTMYNRLLELEPDDEIVWNNKALALGDLGRYNEALLAIDTAISLNPNNVETLNNKGGILARFHRLDEALSVFDKSISLKPDNVEALSGKGAVFGELGKYEQSLQTLEKALSLDNNSSLAWHSKGATLVNICRYEEALQAFEKALSLKPRSAKLWYNKGSTLVLLSRNEEALQAFKRAINLEPNYVEAWCNQGGTLSTLGRNEEAIQSYEKAISLNPKIAIAWNNKGVSLKELGRHKEALLSFEKAIILEPNYEQAWINKGKLLEELGRTNESLKSYEKAKKLTNK